MQTNKEDKIKRAIDETIFLLEMSPPSNLARALLVGLANTVQQQTLKRVEEMVKKDIQKEEHAPSIQRRNIYKILDDLLSKLKEMKSNDN